MSFAKQKLKFWMPGLAFILHPIIFTYCFLHMTNRWCIGLMVANFVGSVWTAKFLYECKEIIRSSYKIAFLSLSYLGVFLEFHFVSGQSVESIVDYYKESILFSCVLFAGHVLFSILLGVACARDKAVDSP